MTTNVQRLQNAGILPGDDQISQVQRDTVEDLSEDEVDALISSDEKLADVDLDLRVTTTSGEFL